MKHNPIITLFTDFGTSDPYAGIMKGVILSINPGARIIDLCHTVPPQDIRAGGLIFKSAYSFFPDKTIHLAVVDPGVGSRRAPILIETEKFFFIGPDNGLFSHILSKEKVIKIIALANTDYFLENISSTFHGRDIFAPAAAHLSKGLAPETFGPLLNNPVMIDFPEPLILSSGEIKGEIIHADHFGNLITNIDRNCLEKSDKPFCAEIKHLKIKKLLSCYADAENKEPFCLIGSTGQLEISVKNQSAQIQTGIKKGDKIRIFRD